MRTTTRGNNRKNTRAVKNPPATAKNTPPAKEPRETIYTNVPDAAELQRLLNLASGQGNPVYIELDQDIIIDMPLTITLPIRVIIRSNTRELRKLTRAFNGPMFTTIGDGDDLYVVIYSVIIDGNGDNYSGALFNMPTLPASLMEGVLLLGNVYDDTYNFIIENCRVDTPGESLITLRGSTSGLFMYGDSVIRNCTVVSDAAAVSAEQRSNLFRLLSGGGLSFSGRIKVYGNKVSLNGNGSTHSALMYVEGDSNNNVFATFSLNTGSEIYDNDAGILIHVEAAFCYLSENSSIHSNRVSLCVVLATNTSVVNAATRWIQTNGKINDNIIRRIESVTPNDWNQESALILLNHGAIHRMEYGEIQRNVAYDGVSGICSNDVTCAVNVLGGSISYNTSSDNGGAIRIMKYVNYHDGKTIVSNCEMKGNYAPDGGSLYMFGYYNHIIGPNIDFEKNRCDNYWHSISLPTFTGTYNASGVTSTEPFANPFNGADIASYYGTNNRSERVPYVRFDLGGGDGSAAEQIMTPGAYATTPPNPVKPGYRFLGWYTHPTGGVRWDFSTMKPENAVQTRAPGYGLMLYARWSNGRIKKITCADRWRNRRVRMKKRRRQLW